MHTWRLRNDRGRSGAYFPDICGPCSWTLRDSASIDICVVTRPARDLSTSLHNMPFWSWRSLDAKECRGPAVTKTVCKALNHCFGMCDDLPLEVGKHPCSSFLSLPGTRRRERKRQLHLLPFRALVLQRCHGHRIGRLRSCKSPKVAFRAWDIFGMLVVFRLLELQVSCKQKERMYTV